MSDDIGNEISVSGDGGSTDLTLTYPGVVEVQIKAPKGISYSHVQNLSLVARSHSILVRVRTIGPSANGELTLRATLTSQNRDISRTAFLSLGEAGYNDWRPLTYELDSDFLLEVLETTPASFAFGILDGADEVAHGSTPASLYPSNLWLGSPEDKWLSSGLLLTSFVRPLDPALAPILTRARELKGTYTSSSGNRFEPNTRGYQAGPEEVHAEVRALYEAVQELGINYSNPPGSKDFTNGQIIRSSKEILTAKAATCLDSTVLFAALLENINLRPILAITPVHAFVGYWTTPRGGFSSAVAPTEEAILRNSLEVPELRFVETTTMCSSENQLGFDLSVSLAEQTLRGASKRADLAPIAQADWRVIDLTTARRSGYRPMAQKVLNADGTSSLIEYSIENAPVDMNIVVEDPKMLATKDTSPVRVRHWKSQLLDLSYNNPLLNMSRRSSSQVKLFIPPTRLGDIENFLQQGTADLRLVPGYTKSDSQFSFWGLAEDGSTPVSYQAATESAFIDNKAVFFQAARIQRKVRNEDELIKALFSKIRNLSRGAKTSIEETGINNLYMTFGSLRWKRKDKNGENDPYVVSPLILLPVTLKAVDKGRNWVLALDDSNDVATNETLALKLLSDYNISIPELTNPEQDEAGIDISGLLQSVRKAIIDSKQTTWLVTEDASIGTYDFSTFHMWKDLNDNWEKLSRSPLVKHLIETDGTEAFVDPSASSEPVTEVELDEELAKVPVPSDGTQLMAIVKSLRGETFVIQGPPGTGKSQTITNLLARNLQAGKKVLFMSEKPAALDVVKTRLDEIRLGSFVLDLHSKNTSAAEIRNQLLSALDANPVVDKAGIDSANFDFDVASKALSKYPERLHRVHEGFGESVYSTRDKILALPDSGTLTISRAALAYFDQKKLLAFRSKLQELDDVGGQAGVASLNPWSMSNLPADQIDVELRTRLASALQVLLPKLATSLSKGAQQSVLAKVQSLEEAQSLSKAPLNSPSLEDIRQLSQFEYKQRLGLHKDQLNALLAKASGGTADPSLGTAPLTDISGELKQAMDSLLFKKKKIGLTASKLEKLLGRPVSEANVSDSLEIALDLQQSAKSLVESSFGIPCLSPMNLSEVFGEGTLQERLSTIAEIERLQLDVAEGKESASLDFLSLATSDRQDLQSLLTGLLEIFGLLQADSESFALWSSGNLSTRLSQVRDKWESELIDSGFRPLVRWSNLLGLVEELREAGQEEARRQILSGDVEMTDAPRAFERGYLSLLLEKLLDDHELGNFEASSQSANISKLKKSTESLRVFNRDTIAGAVVQSRTFDPTSIAGRAGALRSELNKQKGQLPIRQLMKRYWETITEITPCVAASPDSVARFLDVDLAHFDLVVFDEASQLRVPNSIGALGRGKAAIIVGDSKQMPPTNLFAAAAEEDEEVPLGAEPDIESILTMAEFSRMPRVMLKWHYRSQDESLIAFSNINYYQNELASFPSPAEKNDGERAIQFHYVKDGEYFRSSKAAKKAQGAKASDEFADESATEDEENVGIETNEVSAVNTNPREADAVVAEVLKLYKLHGAKLSLGVVTMNEAQRQAIKDKLDEVGDLGLAQLMDMKQNPTNYLFVRALEKVQGDERDIIFMSIGFSRVPDPKAPRGFTVPQTFGPLIKAGSERRLNVAVTRARQKVTVFCSFQPDDLRITETSSRGMSGLRDYLKLALDGPEAAGLATQSGFSAPERHRIDLSLALQSRGYKTKQSLGLSNFKVDVAVEHPNRPGEYVLALLLDGPGWRGRPTANDRDVLPVGILQNNMGWTGVERIWLPVWLKEREAELDRVEKRIQELLDQPPAPVQDIEVEDVPDLSELIKSAQIAEPTPTASQPIVSKGVGGVNIDDIEPFAEVRPSLVTQDKSHIQYTNHPEVIRVVSELIAHLTKFEGPVHPDRAVGFVAKCFGLSHVQAARSEAILAAIPRAKFTRDAEGFIYPENVSISGFKTWKRKDKGTPRDVAMISQGELANAMRDLCAKTHGLEHEELLRQTLFAFGQKTLGSLLRKRLESAVNSALERKILKLNGDHYEPAEI